MPLSPYIVDRFGGLDVYNDPQEVGATSAVDLLNVDVDVRGRVRNRDGSTALTSAAASTHIGGMSYSNAGGVEEIVATVGPATVTPYLLSSGAVGTTQAASPGSNNSFARFGNTTNKRLYMAAGSLYRYNGSAWATIGAAPFGSLSLAAVTPNDNRLVITDGTTIQWSSATDPETFDSTDFVTLWPGDGEIVSALVRWRDKLFAFKQTKFAVFSNTSVDNDGGAVFNYYGVDAGRGALASGTPAVAGEEGVYFADSTGVYLTTGDAPVYISQAIEPYLRALSYGSLPTISASGGTTLVYHDRRLYVHFPSGPTYVTLVYDPSLRVWLVWQFGALAMANVPQSSAYRGLYFGHVASQKVAKVDPAVATDQGAAVSWSYTSGAYDVSDGNRVAVTSESAVWGTGAATLRVANDHGSFDTGSALTLGASPAVAQTWQQIDREGTYWQHKFSGSSAGTVNRLVHYVSFVKPSGIG